MFVSKYSLTPFSCNRNRTVLFRMVGGPGRDQASDCCFCLSLRTGAILIGCSNCLLYLSLFTAYLLTHNTPGPATLTTHTQDIGVFFLFCTQVLTQTASWLRCFHRFIKLKISVQMLVNCLLVLGAVRRAPGQLTPWLTVSGLTCLVLLLLLLFTLLLGPTGLQLSTLQYSVTLAASTVFTAAQIFSWFVVFTMRCNARLAAVARPAKPGPPPPGDSRGADWGGQAIAGGSTILHIIASGDDIYG